MKIINKLKEEEKILKEGVNKVCEGLGIEFIIKNKEHKFLNREIETYVWHCFLIGAMIKDLGGFEKILNITKKGYEKNNKN